MDKYSMEITKKEFDSFFNREYFIEYGYFAFKREKLSTVLDEDYKDFEEEYQTTVSDMFSRKLWSMESVNEYIKENNIMFNKDFVTIPIEMHCAKSEYTKRKYKFINLYNYIRISDHLIENSKVVENLFLKDIHSTSKFLTSSFSANNIRKKKDVNSKNKKYILKTDLSNFFYSIYTHTIPWVMIGKKEAKKRVKKEFSNKLDSLIQNSQDGETKGVPTGSILTRFIVEMYQLKIDQDLSKKLNIHFHRYVDDYNFYFNKDIEKEKVLKEIYSIYSDVELQLNENKIKVTSFPEHTSHSIVIDDYFKSYHYLTVSIIEDSELDSNKKASKIVKIIYKFIDYYSALSREYVIKQPPYFAIEIYLLEIKEMDIEVYKHLLEKDFLFELFAFFLLEMKHLQYFLNFIEKIFVDSDNNLKRTFKKYESILDEKLKEYFEGGFQVETSYLLTLRLIYPYFFYKKEILSNIIENGDSFNAIMAYKILFNYSPTDEIYAIDASISRIKKYGKLMKETRKEEIFSFQNENFIFEYEIGRLYKNNKNIKKQFTQSDKKLFTESLKKGNEIKNFYLDMINENIKIFLK